MADNSHLDQFAAKYGLGNKAAAPIGQPKVQKPVDPTEAFGNFLINKTTAAASGLQDKNQYGRMSTFDSSPTGAFKDRYKAYGQETYNRIGFDPLINNEQNFTSQTSTYDDAKRWLTSAALPMAGIGFFDPLRSYRDVLQGNAFQGNTESAKDYEYYNMLGYSSRGGVGGFGVNLLNSFSYSAGVMFEGALEGAAIGAAVGAVGGEGVGAIPGAAIGGLVEGVAAMTKIPRALYQTAKTIGKLSKTIKSLSAVNNAKNFWNTAKSGGAAVLKTLNPLENSTEAMLNLSKWKDVDNMTGLARASRTAGAFWHDMMSMNLALSEGKLEGGFSELSRYENEYNKYYAKHGKAPDDETQRQMVINAKQAGRMNTLANTALVFYSNKIALPSITKAKFLKGLPSLNAGKVAGMVGKEFQLVVNNADDIAKASMEKVPITFRNSLKALTSPRKMGSTAINYFKANLVEGLQEVGQDALSSAVEDYYSKSFNDPSVKGYRMGMSALADGLSKQSLFSETFLSGFAMGSLLQGPSTLVKHGSRLGNKIFKSKESYDTYMKQKSEEADRIVNAFNGMVGENARHLFNPAINSYASLNRLARKVDNPDDTTTKELKDDSAAAFSLNILTSITNGTFDMYMDHIKNYKNATPEEIEEAWHLEKGEGQKALEGLDKAISNANTIKNRFEFAQKNKRPVVLKEKFKKDSIEYKKAELYEKAYYESLKSFVFLQSSFDDTLERLDSLYGSLAKFDTISGNPFANFSILTNDPVRLEREIEMLKTDIELGEKSTDATSQLQAQEKRELLSSLYNFKEAQDKLTNTLFIGKLQGVDSAELLEKMKEEGVDVKDDYAAAFKKVLHAMAGSSDKRAKLENEIQDNGGFEDLFDKLYDTHLLTKDRQVLSDYINLLTEPTEFYEHLDRNFQWMSKLYDNKKEYIKEIVNQEFKQAEQNEVLNELASKGIFVDLEKFADWVEDPEKIPTEFIDTTNNLVINEASALYDEYATIFLRAADAIKTPAAGEPLSEKEKLEEKLSDLRNERTQKLNEARENYEQQFVEETGEQLATVEGKNSDIEQSNETLKSAQESAQKNIDLLTNALEALNGNDAVEINKSIKALMDNNILSQNEIDDILDALDSPTIEQEFAAMYGLLKTDASEIERRDAASYMLGLPNAIAGIIQDNNALLTTEPQEKIDIESTKAYQVYDQLTQQINAEYDKYEEEVKQEFADKGIDENTIDEITKDTPYDNMPDDLKAIIDQEYDNFLTSIGDDPQYLKDFKPNEYADSRANWIEHSAGQIIKDYNLKVSAEAREKAERLKSPPYIKYLKKQIKNDDTTFEINSLYKKLKQLLDSGKNLKGKDLTADEKEMIKTDLENLAGYLDARNKTYKPASVAQKVVDTIVNRVIARRDEVEDVIDENGKKTRKFAGEETAPTEETKTLRRVTQIADKVAKDITGNKWPGYNKKDNIVKIFTNILESESDPEKAVKSFINAFKLKAKTNYLQFDSKKKLDKIEEELLKNPTAERLADLIDEYAYIESTDAGTKVDDLIRKFLTLDKGSGEGFTEVKYSGSIEINGVDYKVSDFMSQEAFDKLFGPGGIVSSIRSKMIDGEFVLFPENILVFDKTLGITGEIDLLAVNGKGEVMIIDIKTSKNWDDYRLEKNFNHLKHRAQLSIYATLLHNMTGLTVNNLKILPLQIELTVDGYVKNIGKAMTTIFDEDGNRVKMPDGTTNKRELLASGYFDLEFLPEIEDEGVVMITPDFADEITEEGTEEEGTGETPRTKTELEEAEELNNLTLNKLVNKMVMHEGSPAKLIVLSDGSYAVEKSVVNTKDINALKLLLQQLESDLEYENAPDNKLKSEAYIDILNESIAKTKKDIEEIENSTGKEVRKLFHKLKPVTNGNLNPMELGINVITGVTSPFEVSNINGKIVKAKFTNEDETSAIINGVRYQVYRDKSGSITALSYMRNDKKIEAAEQEIAELNQELARIVKFVKDKNIKQRSVVSRLVLLNKVQNIKDEIARLEAEKQDLLANNDQVFEKGGNSNDYIFALNTLPNKFQKATKKFKPEDEEKHFKEIDKLSLSASISKAITEILAEEYPETLDILFDVGVQGINLSELNYIYNWIDKTVDKLNKLGESVINRGDLVDDISNQINALLQLKNDLNLIKIINDGKTKKPRFSKQQAAANKIFGPTTRKVQKRTDVSKNEKPVNRQAETVSGLPAERVGTEELKEIVNKARSTAIIPTEGAEKVSTSANEYLDKIVNASDIKELDAARDNAINNREDSLKLSEIMEAYNKRKAELATKVSSNTLKKGSLLISKTDIFEGAKNVVVELVSMDKNTKLITVKVYGTDTKRTFTEQELKDNFTKYSKEAMEAEQQNQTPVTEETIELANESKDTVKDFTNDTDLQKKIIDDAENLTEDELIKKFKNNSNIC